MYNDQKSARKRLRKSQTWEPELEFEVGFQQDLRRLNPFSSLSCRLRPIKSFLYLLYHVIAETSIITVRLLKV